MLDRSYLLHSLPKQTKKTALINLLVMTSESLDSRMCLLAKQGEAAILRRETGMLECHQVMLSREKRNKKKESKECMEAQSDNVHTGACSSTGMEPAIALVWCLRAWSSEAKKTAVGFVCFLLKGPFFTPCYFLSEITQWTAGVKIRIQGELKGSGRETVGHSPLLTWERTIVT